jgi:uncharacterized membrane-anchored protein YitT (DUF2179 family)
MATPPTGTSPLIERVRRILLEPKAEWARIDEEPATVGAIYRNWVLVLAAVSVLCGAIGLLLFGFSLLGYSYRPGIGDAVGIAITNYVATILSVFVSALIIDALAPAFGGTKNRVQATKVAAYAMTASWVAGIAGLFPPVGRIFMFLGALYSVYLLYLGLPRLMKAPADKAVGYTVAVVVVAIAVSLVAGLVLEAIVPSTGNRIAP